MITVTSNYLEIDESALDLLAWNVSNEVINGFNVPDFEKTIGASKQEFQVICVALRGLPKGTKPGFDLKKAHIFRNALVIVLEELGEEEFDTRTGHSIEEGRTILQQLSLFVDRQQGGQD
jgi:hypothetical protein